MKPVAAEKAERGVMVEAATVAAVMVAMGVMVARKAVRRVVARVALTPAAKAVTDAAIVAMARGRKPTTASAAPNRPSLQTPRQRQKAQRRPAARVSVGSAPGVAVAVAESAVTVKACAGTTPHSRRRPSWMHRRLPQQLPQA